MFKIIGPFDDAIDDRIDVTANSFTPTKNDRSTNFDDKKLAEDFELNKEHSSAD